MSEDLLGSPPSSVVPRVTVAMPVYNAGKYLRDAVISIVRQTFIDWELLVVDDGSTDGALRSISDIRDVRIRIIRHNQNKGLATRLNEVIDMARGTYFARMDQDDISYPERFAKQVEALDANPEIDLIATRALTIDEGGNVTGLLPFRQSHGEICAHPWLGFYFPHPTWMGRTEWFKKVRYAEPAPYLCEDQELLLRSRLDSQFSTLNDIQFAYRIRKTVDSKKLAKTRDSVRRMQAAYYFGKRGGWGQLLLTQMAFVGRVVSDKLRQSMPSIFQRSDEIDPVILAKWHMVLAEIKAEAQRPC